MGAECKALGRAIAHARGHTAEKLSMDTKAFIEKGGGDSFLSRAEPVLTKKQMFERQSSPRGSVASSTSSRAHMRGSQSSPRLYV